MPSIRKKLLRFVCPLMAGKTKLPPVKTLPNPPAFWETLTGATPGVRERSWVKFSPFSGKFEHLLRGYDRAQLSGRRLDELARGFHGHALLDGPDLHGQVKRGGLIHRKGDLWNLGHFKPRRRRLQGVFPWRDAQEEIVARSVGDGIVRHRRSHVLQRDLYIRNDAAADVADNPRDRGRRQLRKALKLCDRDEKNGHDGQLLEARTRHSSSPLGQGTSRLLLVCVCILSKRSGVVKGKVAVFLNISENRG